MLKSVDLYIDAYIGKDQGQGIFGGEKSFGLSHLNEFLSSLEKDVTDISVHINSGGGSVDEGFAIYDKLNNSPYSITTIAEGTVGSIATIIYMAGQTRKMFENSKFFIHNPYFIPSGPDALESKDAQKLADELRAEEERILNFYIQKTGKKAEEIKPFMDAQTSFTSKEAIEMGFATDIVKKEVQNKKQYKLVAYKENLKNETMKKEEQVSWFKKIENMLNKISIKNEVEVKAAMTKTSEGVEVWFSGPLEVGTKIWLDEAMTMPAPDGVHTVGNIKCDVVDGIVKSIEEVVNETEALKTENEKLKAELEAAKSEANELKNKQAETEKTIGELKVEIINFKKVVIGGEIPKVISQNFSKNKEVVSRFENTKKNIVARYGKK